MRFWAYASLFALSLALFLPAKTAMAESEAAATESISSDVVGPQPEKWQSLNAMMGLKSRAAEARSRIPSEVAKVLAPEAPPLPDVKIRPTFMPIRPNIKFEQAQKKPEPPPELAALPPPPPKPKPKQRAEQNLNEDLLTLEKLRQAIQAVGAEKAFEQMTPQGGVGLDDIPTPPENSNNKQKQTPRNNS